MCLIFLTLSIICFSYRFTGISIFFQGLFRSGNSAARGGIGGIFTHFTPLFFPLKRFFDIFSRVKYNSALTGGFQHFPGHFFALAQFTLSSRRSFSGSRTFRGANLTFFTRGFYLRPIPGFQFLCGFHQCGTFLDNAFSGFSHSRQCCISISRRIDPAQLGVKFTHFL